jgi:hypothetical protein
MKLGPMAFKRAPGVAVLRSIFFHSGIRDREGSSSMASRAQDSGVPDRVRPHRPHWIVRSESSFLNPMRSVSFPAVPLIVAGGS